VSWIARFLINHSSSRSITLFDKEAHLSSAINSGIANALVEAPAAGSWINRSGARAVITAFALAVADCLSMLVAAVGAVLCTAPHWFDPRALSLQAGMPVGPDLIAIYIALLGYFVTKGRYRERVPFWTETRSMVCASFCAAGAEAVFKLLTNDFATAGTALLALLSFPILATVANRLTKHGLTRAGLWTLPVVIIADQQTAADVEEGLASDRSLGYEILGRVDPEAVTLAAGRSRLWPILDGCGARRVLIALHGEQQRLVVATALRERVPFAVVSSPVACPAFTCESAALLSHDTMLLSFQDGLSRPLARLAKTAIDISLALVGLIITSPLFLVLAVLSKQDGGPVLFAHQRVGAGGRLFKCLKFRTMVVDADRVLAEALEHDPALAAEWEATRKLANDPRVTRIGQFLRKTSLDELPQLINVLRLEMSLVGPRPIVQSEVPLYGENIAQYFATRPGLTGLWQVSGRSTTSYARRVQLDVWYVNNWTIWYDITVLLKTIPAVLSRQGAC
jgi:Undecaprenyl-phosphate galactose phosphotransferase WbaP